MTASAFITKVVVLEFSQGILLSKQKEKEIKHESLVIISYINIFYSCYQHWKNEWKFSLFFIEKRVLFTIVNILSVCSTTFLDEFSQFSLTNDKDYYRNFFSE